VQKSGFDHLRKVELLRFWRGLKQKIESVEIHQK
jgi:hypothetical protein